MRAGVGEAARAFASSRCSDEVVGVDAFDNNRDSVELFLSSCENFFVAAFIYVFLCAGALLTCGARAGAQTTGKATASYADAKASCGHILSPSDAVTSTLKDLYNHHDLTVEQLIAIRHGQNPLKAKRGTNEQAFGDVIAAVIERIKNNPEAQRQLDSLIEGALIDTHEKNTIVTRTRKMYLPMTFYDIEPGQFVMVASSDGPLQIRSNLRQHNVYISKSFRIANIPVAQWEYLVRSAGAWTGHYPDGVTDANLRQFAWYRQNSCKPCVISGIDEVVERVAVAFRFHRGQF